MDISVRTVELKDARRRPGARPLSAPSPSAPTTPSHRRGAAHERGNAARQPKRGPPARDDQAALRPARHDRNRRTGPRPARGPARTAGRAMRGTRGETDAAGLVVTARNRRVVRDGAGNPEHAQAESCASQSGSATATRKRERMSTGALTAALRLATQVRSFGPYRTDPRCGGLRANKGVGRRSCRRADHSEAERIAEGGELLSSESPGQAVDAHRTERARNAIRHESAGRVGI